MTRSRLCLSVCLSVLSLVFVSAVVQAQPEIDFDPATLTLDADNVRLGTSQNLTLTITNTGTSALAVNVNSLTGDRFSFVSGHGLFALDPSASRDVVVRYTPNARGADDFDTGTFRVVSNDSDEGVVIIQLKGNGVAPDYSLSATTLAYGNQRVGLYRDLVVTLTNTGNDAATFTSAVVTGNEACGDYSVQSGGDYGTINPNGTRDITVRFTPSQRGARNCSTSLTITVEDPANETGTITRTVGLTGTGIAPVYPPPEESDGVNNGTLDFGTTNVGVPVTRTVTVRNTGDDDAGNVRATIVGGNGCTQFTIVSGGNPETLTSGTGVKVITVRFLATSIGDFTCNPSLRIQGEDPDNETNTDYIIRDIELVASAGVPDIALLGEPVTLNFGNVRVGSTSAPQNVTINNVGNAALSVTSYTLGAPYAISSHGTSGAPSYTLNPNGSNIIGVTCTPTARGAANGTLRIHSNDPDEPTKDVTLQCNGIAPVPGVSPANHNFGNVPIGQNSTTQLFTVSNTGDDPMTIESIGLTGANADQFSIVSNTCGATLDPSSTCAVEVRFNPTSFGNKNAVLRVRTETTASETGRQNNDVALSGRGTNAPEIELLPSDTGPGDPPHLTRNFGSVAVGSFFDVFFEIRNVGTANLTGTVNAPAPNPPFSIVSGGGAFNLRPNATRRVTLRCRPTTAGDFAGTLTITGINDADEPTKTIALNCTGAAPDINVDPLNINFGNVRRGTNSTVQNVTIENDGAAPLTLTNVFISTNPAVFTVIRPAGCLRFPCTIQPGDELVFGVRARPNRLGAIAGNLRITSNDPDEATVNVPLAVNGTLLAPGSGNLLTLEGQFNVTDLQLKQTGNAIEFRAVGGGLRGLQVELYDLQGRKIAEASSESQTLHLKLLNRDGKPLANGVYLYVLTYQGANGILIRDRIEKIVIRR